MQFSSILTPLVAAFSLAGAAVPIATWCVSPAHAQGRDNAHFDDVITDMAQAFKLRDRKKLAALAPQVRGYILEPWAAYWDLSTRLDEAGPSELQDFFTR